MTILEAAKEYLRNGFSVIPVGANKTPSIGNWRQYQKRAPTLDEAETIFKDAHSIAMLCGGPWRVFCVDIDHKNSLDGQLWDRFKEVIPKSILMKGLKQSTKNNGYHYVVKVPSNCLDGNKKLASRYTTPEEQHITYMEYYNNPDTRNFALRTATNDKTKCMIECRSGTPEIAGGYFIISPSPNYTHLHGKIEEISEEEYRLLIEGIKSLNEVREVEKKNYQSDEWELSPFEHFSQEGDIVELLLDSGWTTLPHRGKDVRLRRPGNTSQTSSAIVDTIKNVLYVFSSSTVFQNEIGYNAVSVLSKLNFDDDMSRTYQYLIQKGYGKRK